MNTKNDIAQKPSSCMKLVKNNDNSKKQKVVYLTSLYPSLSHTFIRREVEFLEKSGVEVSLASVRKPKNLQELGEIEQAHAKKTFYLLSNIKRVFMVHSIKDVVGMLSRVRTLISKQPGRIHKVIAYFLEALVLVQWMRTNKVTHIHNHFGNSAGTLAYIAAGASGIDYSLSVHGPDIFQTIDTEWFSLKLSHAEKIRVISHFCDSQVKLHMPPEEWYKTRIIRCGIEPEGYSMSKREDPDIKTILCVGRLVPAKGQAILLKSFCELQKSHPDCRLVYVGNGPDEDSLKALAEDLKLSDKLEFTGGLNSDDVKDWYRRADLFVLPSFAEGIPVVLMEAMASGIPVISTQIAGIPELIEHGRSGIIIPPGSVSALTQELSNLLDSPKKRNALAVHGREKVLRNYDVYSNNVLLLDFFNPNPQNND